MARTAPLDTGDGFKFWVDDGSWLLVRFSGTEPLVRVYTEASSAALRDALLAEGGHMVRARQRAAMATQDAAISGGILDDAAAMARADPAGMLGLVAALPDQVADAWRISRALSLPVARRRGRWPSWAWAARPSAATSSRASGPIG